MGRSAKLHKRTQKKIASTASAAAPTPSAKSKPTAAPTPAEQRKKAGLKAKAKAGAPKRKDDGPVLGGADYVELMLGSRRRAAAEAGKLPMDEDEA